jgi:acyl carrier protein
VEKQEIITTISTILSSKFIPGQVFDKNTSLIKSKMMDSIAVLNFVNTLEQTFNIEFEAHEVDVDNLDTVQIVADFVIKKSIKQ